MPAAVVRHLRNALRYRVQIKPADIAPNKRYRYFQRIRDYLQVRAYADGGLEVATAPSMKPPPSWTIPPT